jgi:Flp pilus assembly protein TadD
MVRAIVIGLVVVSGGAAIAISFLGFRPTRTALERGYAALNDEDFEAAVELLNEAVQVQPYAWQCWWGRGLAKAKLNQAEEAIADLTEAIKLSPNQRETLLLRSELRQATKDFQGAADDYTGVLRQTPDDFQLRVARGWCLEQTKNYPAAIREYREALKVADDYNPARNRLARVLACAPSAEVRNGGEALLHAAKACSAEKTNGDFMDTLAAACAEKGLFADAVRWETKAIELAAAQPEESEAFAARKALYEKNQPYRLP